MSHPLYASPRKSQQLAEVPHTCYQIDFAAIKCGKMVAASKRRIRFKFGYTNTEAISSGATGTDCRGSEHELTITWSLSSGKQSVVMDGKEMFFDVGDTTKVKCVFKDKDEHTLEVKAHAAPLSTKSNPDPDWKQYDLLIDGISYFRYPKIYQLGVFTNDEAQGSTTFRQKGMLHIDTEPAYGNTALESVLPKEEEKHVEVADLLSFDESEVVAVPVQTNNAPANMPPSHAAPAPSLMAYSANQYSQNFSSAPTISPFDNQYAQQISHPNPPVTPSEMVQSNTPNAQNNQYSNYQVNPFDAQANPNPPTATYNNYEQGMQAFNQAPQAQLIASPQAPISITPNSSSQALVPTANATATGAVSNLVNMDDLFAPSAATIAKQAPKAPAQQGEKKPIMNSFSPQQPMYQQQHQQGMYQQGMYQQQQQPQMGFPQYQQQYPQQGYAQPGYHQPSH